MTANERFKQGFAARMWGGIVMATLAHVALFAFWPELTAQDIGTNPDEMQIFDIPPEVKMPEAPEHIVRPAAPVIADTDISQEITIARTTFQDNPVSTLPPPSEAVSNDDLPPGRTFTPFTVRPGIRNRGEVARALEREYPALLRDAGIGGSVEVYFYIDETGKVQKTEVEISSGHTALDEAALKVADVIRFTPALNRDKQVAVWISLPITFRVR